MIVDLRIYTVTPGKMAAYIKMYEELAWPLQQKYLGRCLGWYTTSEGELNTVVHMWGYDSQADRETRRAAMAKDPAWQSFLKTSAEAAMLQKQENRILTPTAFSPAQ